MVAWTLDCRRSSAMVAAPSTAPKRPRTLVIMRWRAVNPTVVCDPSMVQVPGVRSLIEAIGGPPSCVRVSNCSNSFVSASIPESS